MASVKENFARNLSALLKSHGKKGKELAEHLNIDPSTVTGWRKGKFTPAVERLDEIADFFGVSYLELIAGDGKASPPVRDLDSIIRELAAARGFRISKS